MQYILFFVALITALFTIGFAIIGVAIYAYYHPEEKWLRTAAWAVIAIIYWAILSSI